MSAYDDERVPEERRVEDVSEDLDATVATDSTSTSTVSPDVVNIEVGSLEITGTPEDRFALGETIYNLPLRYRFIIMGVIGAIMLISAFVLSPVFSNPDTYSNITQTLDAKKANVLALTAAATSASTAISLIPDDVGSAVADKLADLSIGFLIILVAIFLEKYLLTIIGFIFFGILVPVCGGLYIASLALTTYRATRKSFAVIATKLLLMGIAFLLLVPTSVGISNMIDTTYEESIDQTIAQAEQSSQQVEEIVEEQHSQESANGQEEEGDVFSWFADRWADVQEFAGGVVEQVGGAITSATTWFQGILNDFIEAMAVMFVTSCIIPILVLILFLFIVKAIFNVDISKPIQMLDPRTYRKARTTSMTKAKR